MSFYRTRPDDWFLCLPVILRRFSDYLFYRAPLGSCLFHLQVALFQPPDTIKIFSQVLFKYFKENETYLFGGIKILGNYLWISYSIMKLRDANLQTNEKTSFRHAFCFHFLRIHYDYFFQKVFESVWPQFLSGNIMGLLVIYLFNDDPSKSTFSMLNMQLGGFLKYSFCQINWDSFISCNVKINRTSFFLLCALCSVFWYVVSYRNLIFLHHGDNNFLFYFDICIKFTLSLIISTMKKWQHLTWCVPFCDKNMFERKQKHSIIAKFRILRALIKRITLATGFKSLQLKYWDINQATSTSQIDLWTKFAKKV